MGGGLAGAGGGRIGLGASPVSDWSKRIGFAAERQPPGVPRGPCGTFERLEESHEDGRVDHPYPDDACQCGSVQSTCVRNLRTYSVITAFICAAISTRPSAMAVTFSSDWHK